VRIDPDFAVPARTGRPKADRGLRSPSQLFEEYCATRNVNDQRVAALFAQLHDEVTAIGGAD
jgi:exonuclease SbcD